VIRRSPNLRNSLKNFPFPSGYHPPNFTSVMQISQLITRKGYLTCLVAPRGAPITSASRPSPARTAHVGSTELTINRARTRQKSVVLSPYA
jgi:hypothetical protein